MRRGLMVVTLGLLAGCLLGQAGPVPEMPAEAKSALQMLQDRKKDLHDFTSKIDVNTVNRLGDSSGKRGMLDFVMDPTKGPVFSADFAWDTRDGRLLAKHHQQIVFDGKNLLVLDFESKQFALNNMLPAGAKPGDAVTLNGPMPLPIGLDVEDVARNFEVSVLPAKAEGQQVLRLVPRDKDKFDYRELVITVDMRPEMRLPVKLVQTDKKGDATAITLEEIHLNDGKAKVPAAEPPAGWQTMQKDNPGNGGK